jgi:hypothetical protein
LETGCVPVLRRETSLSTSPVEIAICPPRSSADDDRQAPIGARPIALATQRLRSERYRSRRDPAAEAVLLERNRDWKASLSAAEVPVLYGVAVRALGGCPRLPPRRRILVPSPRRRGPAPVRLAWCGRV